MAKSKYSKYVITEPKLLEELAHHEYDPSHVSGFTYPVEVYIGRGILREANQYLNISWTWELPSPRTQPVAHSHPFDEILLFIGSNPKDLRDFGAEIEFWMGEGKYAERFIINTTTLFYIPKGLVHGPQTFLKVEKPVLTIAMGLNTQNYL